MYSVELHNCGPYKLQIIKLLKDELGIGLKEAKDLSDSTPCTVFTTSNKDRAYNLMFTLRNNKADAIITSSGVQDETGTMDSESLSAVELFKRYFKNPWSDNDSYAFSCYPYISEDKLRSARNLFGIAPSETILTIHNTAPFWRSMSSATVMTDEAIYYLSEDRDNQFVIPFSQIGDVKYQELVLYFFNKTGEEYATLGIHDLLCYTTYGHEGEHGIDVAAMLTMMVGTVAPLVDPYDAIFQLEGEKKYDEALQLLDQEAVSGTIELNWMYHFYKGRFLVEKEGTLEEHPNDNVKIIEKEFEKAIELSDEDNVSGYCNYWRGYLYRIVGQPFNARNLFILAMDSDSEEMRDDSREQMVLAEEELSGIWDNYTTTYEYKDRKFIMPIKERDIAGCIADGIDTFRMSNIPSCIKFPTGHPVANELYIGHPYNPNIYVPYSESEDIFFLDKIDELKYLLQCLGAEEIEITSIKGRSVSEYESRSGQLSAHLDNGLAEGNGTYGKSSKNEQNRDSKLQRSFKIKCDPMKYPYVPEGLIWYGEQTRWQRMVEARLNGNQLEYSESISTTDTRFVSNTEKKDIKAAAEYLWIKADGSAESNLETQFKEHTETQWRVDVKFRSLRDFSSNQGANQSAEILNSYEQEYLDEFKATLEDGEIGPRERKSLERARVRLGISESRAAEIEASVSTPKLTNEEKEYLDEVKAVLEDGEIGPRERKSLERVRIRLGISEERAKEIEKI